MCTQNGPVGHSLFEVLGGAIHRSQSYAPLGGGIVLCLYRYQFGYNGAGGIEGIRRQTLVHHPAETDIHRLFQSAGHVPPLDEYAV
jgi:hypothetical protein